MTKKQEDRVIELIYRQHCAGMGIDILRIPELFKMARTKLRAGESSEAIGAAMVAFVKGEAA